ncbi:MAG: GlsB/YeaQ/YmgE family stress response membrane protein [Cyanobacteria bacterium J06636_16]
MSLIDFLLLLLVAGICGGLGQAIAGYSRAGCFGSIALGFIGALLGTWIARETQLPEFFVVSVGDGVAFPIVWSVIGSVIFVVVLSLFARPRRR